MAAVLMACGLLHAEERKLSLETYRDKMEGGWLGQIIGVCWGGPTEFRFNHQIIPDEHVTKWTPELINQAFGQDDLYVEMTFIRSMEEHGIDVSIRQAGIDFALISQTAVTACGAPTKRAVTICDSASRRLIRPIRNTISARMTLTTR